jgi:hypothetical protein
LPIANIANASGDSRNALGILFMASLLQKTGSSGVGKRFPQFRPAPNAMSTNTGERHYIPDEENVYCQSGNMFPE